MWLYVQNMNKNMQIYTVLGKFIDCISQICKGYAQNMPKNMLKYAYYMQLHARNMQLYAQICTKYAII